MYLDTYVFQHYMLVYLVKFAEASHPGMYSSQFFARVTFTLSSSLRFPKSPLQSEIDEPLCQVRFPSSNLARLSRISCPADLFVHSISSA